MTKILNLVYNPVQDVYYYFEGYRNAPNDRKEYNEEELIKGLKKIIDFDRKSFLRLTAVSGDVYREIHKLLENTKVSLEEEVSD